MTLTRRDLLKLIGIAGGAQLAALLSQDPTLRGDILVCVFQRGGMDGLNAVIPYGDPYYYRLRSSLRIPEPKAGIEKTAIDLDGFFGLHPSLLSFKKIWDARALAIIHAAGSPYPTHSHFDAMDFIEHGSPGDKTLQSGWLARHLETTGNQNQSPLRAVSIGVIVHSSLHGSVPAVALSTLDEFRLGRQYNIPRLAEFDTTLESLIGFSPLLGAATETARRAAELVDRISLDVEPPRPPAEYPESDFGRSMRMIAQLIKAQVGVEAATVDIAGWDTHINQGAIEGQMPRLLSDLSESLSAFYQDMGEAMNRITVVTMSDFGRRATENAGGGTDHGYGNVMFVIGKNIHGGKVYGKWPGLAPEELAHPGDLAVTTDFRTVLGEIVQKRLLNDRLSDVFPGFTNSQFLGLAG
jgi:uncharacterized protein (DUF1501 family)